MSKMEKLDNSENTHTEEYARQRLLNSPLSFIDELSTEESEVTLILADSNASD